MIRESRFIAADGEALDLDPFAFWPDVASRLVGLGGTEQGENPDYVFHTLYVACGAGPILFTMRFDGLSAQRGTLILRIHELPEVMGAHARQVAISQTQLTELIRDGGAVSLAGTARAGHHYAVLGFIYGDTVATADTLAVEVSRRPAPVDSPSQPTSFRASADRVATAPRIVGDQEGTLTTPTSQLCTRSQLREPVFAVMAAQLGQREGDTAVDRWERVFLARALDRYDVARSGARGLGIGGLGIGGPCDPLASWLAEQGCSLLLTSPETPAVKPELPPGATAAQLDPFAIDGLSGFDFAWATRSGGVGGGDRQAALRFVEEAMRALKPGGLIALVLPVAAPLNRADAARGALLNRADLDRTALLLLSRGHQVAQLRPWGDPVIEPAKAGSPSASAFGLIVRKAS